MTKIPAGGGRGKVYLVPVCHHWNDFASNELGSGVSHFVVIIVNLLSVLGKSALCLRLRVECMCINHNF